MALDYVGSTIASLFTGRQAYRVYDMNFPTISLVPGVKIKNISLSNKSTVPQHPVEDGSYIQDHKIILPREAHVEAFCEDNATYKALLEILNDRTNTYGVQVKELLIENCTFSEVIPTRDAKVLNAIPVTFTLTEIMNVLPVTGLASRDVKDPANADTVGTGEMNGADPSADQAGQILNGGIGINN